MDCARFDRRLDALLDGKCTAPEWQEAEEHARGCTRCRVLLDGMAGGGAVLGEADAEALADAVIARTSGSTCAAARDRLCALVDGQLDRFERELVEGHLSRCEGCTELAGALTLASAVLPAFVELRAPAFLLPGVIAATSRRPPAPSFEDRLAGWLERLAARPRFSLEAAYTCTLLIALVFGNPVAAFKETSARGIAYAQPRVEEMVDRVASGPLGAARALRVELAERARATGPAPERGIFARFAASIDGGWKWLTAYVVQPARAFADRLVEWVSEALAPNHPAAARVTPTEGTTGRLEPAAPSR